MKKNCPKCGREITLTDVDRKVNIYCPECGTKVASNWERWFVAILYGFFLTVVIIIILAGNLQNIPYSHNGLCDVCGAPATYTAHETGLTTSVHEFCYYHAFQWGLGNLFNFKEIPSSVLLPIIIVWMVVWVVSGAVVYKIFGWWYCLDDDK